MSTRTFPDSVHSRKVRGILKQVDHLAREVEKLEVQLQKLEPKRRRIAAHIDEIRVRREQLTCGQHAELARVCPTFSSLLARASVVAHAEKTLKALGMGISPQHDG